MTRHRTSSGSMGKFWGTRGRDEGAGLVIVVGSMLVLAMLAMVALAYTMSGTRFARFDQDYSAAMAAAQSGVDDFISRLNRSEAYGLAVDCDNDAWQGPDVTGNTCGWDSSTPVGWQPVDPSVTGDKAAYFHYAVDASKKLTQGTVTLTVTGRSNGVYRSIETAVGKGGSTDYVYYTDFESGDPANVQAYPPATTASWSNAKKNVCGINGYGNAKYWHDGRNGQGCMEITFIGGDRLDGAVFTNDTIFGSYRSGTTLKPVFLKQVLTANPSCDGAGSTNSSWQTHCMRSGSVADFSGVKPLYANPLYLDDTSAAFASHPGCHYFGSTRIVLNSNGTMTVWNKNSVKDPGPRDPVAIAGPDGIVPSCGSASQLQHDSGATVPVPDEMVVYVGSSGAAMRQCYAGELGGPGGRKLPLGNFSSAFPTSPSSASPSYEADVNMAEDLKRCANGNLYLEGTLQGRTTFAAEASIIVTGDIVLAGGINGADMLGLVATHSVEVFHPRKATYEPTFATAECSTSYWATGKAWRYCPGSESGYSGWPTRYNDPTTGSKVPSDGIQIAGSIQTLQHSFLVQKYDVGGDQGTLLVNGSIAQRWRGIVGQGTNGYAKLYQYDTRLQYSSPPYFPRWANSQWTLRYMGELSTPAEVRG